MVKQIFLLVFVGLLILSSSMSSFAGTVDFLKLSTTRLPYGETIIINGSLASVKIDISGKQENIDQWIDVKTIKAVYTVTGSAPKTVTGAITDNTWQVSIDPLPENSQVVFVFQFSGNLNAKRVGSLIDSILQDTDFIGLFDAFANEAEDKPASVQAAFADQFVKNLTPIISKNLPSSLKASAEKTFAQAFTLEIEQELPSLANLKQSIDDMAEKKIKGVSKGMTASEVKNVVDSMNQKGLGVQEKDLVKNFNKNYNTLANALSKTVSTDLTVKQDLSAAAEIKDFEKYAGLDVGVIYIPQADELRRFFTINIYFGAVEDSPAPAAPENTGSEISNLAKAGNYLQQRLSLTVGMSTADISGNEDSEIKDENAFIYGLGFRFNKYFRLTTGAAVFRSAKDNDLKHRFFIGPSVDLSAFKYIKDIFGKNK